MLITCSGDATLRPFALMDGSLAENPKHGLMQHAESVRPQSAADQDTMPSHERSLPPGAWFAAILLLTSILYFVRLGARALWASEFRWGEIAREMLLTHNFFWPTNNGQVYFDKPLGSYWLVIASTWITGRLDEAATRIPSAASGVLAVGLLILLARRLYDFRTGLIAGFILATSFSFAFWARTAAADVETVVGELAALLIFVNCADRTDWWRIPMWLVMALTSLMKGLLGFVLPMLVIGVFSSLADGWSELAQHIVHGPLRARIHWLIERNRWLFDWRTMVAVPLALVLYFAPFLISHALTGSTQGIYMVYRENIERYFAPFDHRGPVYLYAFVIFELMAPWSSFLPAALAHAHGRPAAAGKASKSDRFLRTFFWTIFIFFTLSGSRRGYYLLPILPAGAILIARIFVISQRELSETARWLLKFGFWVVVLMLIFLAVVLLPSRQFLPYPYSFLPMLPHPRIFVTCWIVSLISTAYVCTHYSKERVLISVGISSYLLLLYLFVVALPAGDQWRGERQFAQAARQLIDGERDELAAFRTQPPVFYLRFSKPIPQYESAVELASAARSGRVRWIILRRRDVPVLNMSAREIVAEPTYPWDSLEHRSNALILMELQPEHSLHSLMGMTTY